MNVQWWTALTFARIEENTGITQTGKGAARANRRERGLIF